MKAVITILLILALGAAGTMAYMWNQQKKSNEELTAKHTQTVAAHKTAITAKEGEVSTLQTKIDAHAKTIAVKDAELKNLKKEHMSAAKGQLDAKDSEIKKLKAAAAEVNEKCTELATKISDIEKQIVEKTKLVAAYKATNDKAEAEVAKLKAVVAKWDASYAEMEAKAIMLKDKLLANEIPVEVSKEFTGNVLTVDTEKDFVIIDLGTEDNLPAGQELGVVRGETYIGKIEVKKAIEDEGNLSWAVTTVLVDETNPVKVGDKVKSTVGTK